MREAEGSLRQDQTLLAMELASVAAGFIGIEVGKQAEAAGPVVMPYRVNILLQNAMLVESWRELNEDVRRWQYVGSGE